MQSDDGQIETITVEKLLVATGRGPVTDGLGAEDAGLVLDRKLWFERQGLHLERLQMFDDQGELTTDAQYSDYADVSGIPYARKIVIDRPQDHYGLILSVAKLQFNQPLEDEKFVLERPPGTEIIDLEKQSLAEKAGDIG